MYNLQTWLVVVLSLSSYVSAFYPWNSDNINLVKSKPKRFIPIRPNNDLLKLDLHKVRRQTNTNQFSVLNSNPPTGGPNSLAINQDGSDYSYFSTFKFGSKAQEMYMLIDTGSANTWVFSSSCKSSACSIHNTFGNEDSSTLKTTSTQWDLAYGTGQVSGVVATDTVSFANFTVNLGFGLATNASDDFNSYPMDGLAGLGRKASDQLGTPTIMEVLKLQTNVVGIHLNRASDGTKDGEIVFGSIDTGKFSGTLAYTKTSNDQAWEIPVQDVFVGGTPGNFTGRTAIIDTGTTFILMPPKDAQILHSMIPGSVANGESFTIPCNTNVKLEISINGVRYGVSPKDYVGKPSSTGSSTCGSNIIGHQAFGATEWILGDVFLKNVYAVFDFDNQQIGFGMPGSGGSLGPASTSSASGTTSSTATATSKSPSASGSTANPSQTDSSLGSEPVRNGSEKNEGLVGYWKVGFSLLLAISLSMSFL